MELTRTGLDVNSGNHLVVIRAGLGVIILALGALVYQITLLDQERGILFVSQKWTAAFGVGILGVFLSLVALAASWTSSGDLLARWFKRGLQGLRRLRFLNLALFLFPIAVYLYLLLGPQGYFFDNLIVRLCLFAVVGFAGALFIMTAGLLDSWLKSVVVAWLLMGAVYKIATIPDVFFYFIPDVVTYPFSLGWSEASRYYYASLFFAERIYELPAHPSVLHPSRYLMQAIPFLIPGLPLWVHRLWQVSLWLVFTAGSAYLLARRLQLKKTWLRLSFSAWAFLFLFQGPVYYHLLVIAMIVIWGFDSRKYWRSMVVVLVASVWAGISRVNWFPVPGLMAATLYFLEVPLGDSERRLDGESYRWQSLMSYLTRPAAWFVLGTLTAFASQALYVFWSGADPRLFTSSFSSDLLWYRLWPNPTYPLGILPAILLVSGPLLLQLIIGLRGIHPVRVLGIAVALFVLFVGGVVVSTKIGGGSNLHNLDAFLTLLLVVAGYIYFERFSRTPSTALSLQAGFGQLLFAAILFIPVAFAVDQGGPVTLPDQEQVNSALATLEELSSEAVARGGEVLFISQRHLVTFDILPDVPLFEEYENVFLMEMAMSGNEYYLGAFYDDLSHQRFDLIISDQQGNRLKGSEFPFGEENDVWVSRVTQPMLEFYQRADLLKRFGIEVLEPKR